jgi:hypothetical protein
MTALPPDGERNLGEQPLAARLAEHDLQPKDLVRASTEQITHRMVTRGAKGRWLTAKVRAKLVRALNIAAGSSYQERDLFTYR